MSRHYRTDRNSSTVHDRSTRHPSPSEYYRKSGGSIAGALAAALLVLAALVLTLAPLLFGALVAVVAGVGAAVGLSRLLPGVVRRVRTALARR